MTILEFLEANVIEYKQAGEHHHVSSANWIGVDCPDCSPGSGKFKLGINLKHRYASCWTCGSQRLLRALADLTGLDTGDIANALGNEREPYHEEVKRHSVGKLEMPSGISLTPHHSHWNYLRKRGFDPEALIKSWCIYGTSLTSNLAWRIIIPIHYQGRVVSWTSRALVDEGVTRYIAAKPEQEILPHKSLLYGEDHCRHAVCVVEGPLDVWRIGPGAAATFGVNFSKAQAAKIAKYPLRLICMDNEPAAQAKARQLCEELLPYPGITFNLTLKSAKDASRASDEEVSQIRKMLE